MAHKGKTRMKESYNGSLIYNDNDLIGINLGADFTAEHEWGIKGLKHLLDVRSNKKGIKARKINSNKHVHPYETPNYLAIVCNGASTPGDICFNSKCLKRTLSSNHKESSEKHFYAAWSDRSFYIHSNKKDNPEATKFLKELYTAFTNKDVCVWLGGGGPFENSGLCFGIVSKMPEEILQYWRDHDKSQHQLTKWVEKTGIHQLLEKAGKRWFALAAPKEINGKFWLNPMEQRIYNSGWYSLDELKLWAENKGPIMKNKD